MKAFSNMVDVLSSTTKTNEKIQALESYFLSADEKDKIWTIALFTGRRPKRTISSTLMRQWCAEYCNIPLWLLDECYHTVGDLSETIALLIDSYNHHLSNPVDLPLHYYIEQFIQLEKAPEADKKAFMLKSWSSLGSTTERFVFNKLLSGSFRVGVSAQLVIKALASIAQLPPSIVAHKLSGKWDPQLTTLDQLLHTNEVEMDMSKPYPFYLAYPLETEPETLGDIKSWQLEWKWDGIRGQLIKRNQEFFVWSRGEELMTDRFPEYELFAQLLPNGIVIDGEIIVADGSKPLPFALMQTRIGRKTLSKKVLQEAPVSFFAYDLLEYNGEDIRQKPLYERRKLLEEVLTTVQHENLQLSPVIECENWDEMIALRQQSRENYAEGFMIKRKDSAYQAGRKRGDWWKFKIEPLTIDAVLIYAQKGTGRRSNLYTDYTFAVQDGDKLVPFAKAYSGLTDKEIAQVDSFVKRNSIEKFGPVRTVKPELVFELAFEGIAKSNRHKSGVSVRFPRISRWRHDKALVDINTLDDLKKLLDVYGK